ncbi:ubiquitin carboxyl-terminal hydrolase 16-like protein [Dermatophagoides farinae]|uniref:Ubiquitin carboxyl-terminal hydrolase n=1 Tax=Dermatophagoides farinae TaxID=6954 RepID=A0A9D4NU03_DERFA|nr:ubiquitin carboxyl-terminal hydrolase 16-like protein [Dermatophagoides farinae]
MAKKNRKQQRRAHNKKLAQTASIKSKRNSATAAVAADNNDEAMMDLLSEKMDGVTTQPSTSSSSSMQGHSAQLNNQPSGLPNLGNTCYFNSVMQVMAQTYPLHHYLRERCQTDFRWNARTFYWNESKQAFTSESLHLLLPPPNSLTIDFLQLQQQIFSRKSTNPRSLLSDVQREKQQFEGYAQQDAQELLITLLDALKKSEILRQKHALLKGLRIEDRRNPTAEDCENAQRYKITAKHSVIDSIFGGQLLSIIHCNECDYRSFTFESFIDLALSLDTTFPQSSSKSVSESSNTIAKNKQQQSAKMKKKNRKNKNNDDDDDDECDGDVESCDEQTAQNHDEEDKSLVGRKKRRQEKKAARRAEQNQIPNGDITPYHSDDENYMGCDDDGDQCQNSEKINNEEIVPSGDILSNVDDDDDDDELKESLPIPAADNCQLSSSSSTTTAKIIDDEFRYKFHLFAHQRMCRTDDDYQNMDLGALLRSFIKEETLDGSNKYLCENCSKRNGGQKMYSKAVRCQLIALPPPVLILQLKRFEASGLGFNKNRMMHKLNTKISFPYRLYLSPYTSRIYEYFSRFYEPECDPQDLSDWNDRRLEYTLYGVVIHSGSLKYGHYMAYVCVRPGSFDGHNIRRFLHLKPFVSDIEHIMQFVYEDLDHRNESSNGTIEHTINNDNNDDDPISTESISSNRESSNNKPTTTADNDDDDDDKNEKNRKWYFISDSSVSSITLESVLRDATSPYMLFYERTK